MFKIGFKTYKFIVLISLIASCSNDESDMAQVNDSQNEDSLETELDLTGAPAKKPYGYWKFADCDVLQGWAQLSETSTSTVQIEIYKNALPNNGGIKVAEGRANQSISILPQKKGFSFSISTPLAAMEGKSVDLFAVGINLEAPTVKVPLMRWIDNAPKVLPMPVNCVKPIVPVNAEGQFDSYRVAWSDEFNGDALDETKWAYRPNGRNTNRVITAYKKQNISLSQGNLVMSLKKEKGEITEYLPQPTKVVSDFSAGGILSRERMKYGYYEAKMRLPTRTGWHSSFFTKYSPLNTPLADIGYDMEIDFMEHTSFYKKIFTNNLHYWKVAPNNTHVVALPTSAQANVVTTVNLPGSFHIWGAEITPDAMHYYFDGKRTKTVQIMKKNNVPIPVNDQNIYLTTTGFLADDVDASNNYLDKAVDTSPLGPNEEGTLDVVLVDWVRFYKKK